LMIIMMLLRRQENPIQKMSLEMLHG